MPCGRYGILELPDRPAPPLAGVVALALVFDGAGLVLLLMALLKAE
jgi:hypothetical protein